MFFKIVFQEFNVEKVQKGRSNYEKGTVVYTFNGQNKTQTIMSFANPAVFAVLKTAVAGNTYLVETARNDAGYEQWSKVTPEGEQAQRQMQAATFNLPVGPASTPVRSTYETPEERKQKQLYIIKQSSISSAIQTLSVGAKTLDSDKVLELAQKFVDFVYDVPALAAAPKMPWVDNPEAGV